MQVTRQIEWGDCDSAGIVFYPNYFRWMDSTYHAFTRLVGFDQNSLPRDYGLFATPLIEGSCRFFSPARCYQKLQITPLVIRLGTTSLSLTYHFAIGDVPVAEGNEIRAFVTQDGNAIVKAPIPEAIRTSLEAYLA